VAANTGTSRGYFYDKTVATSAKRKSWAAAKSGLFPTAGRSKLLLNISATPFSRGRGRLITFDYLKKIPGLTGKGDWHYANVRQA